MGGVPLFLREVPTGAEASSHLTVEHVALGMHPFARISERPFVLFCGAGISADSGLPLANSLKRAALERIIQRNGHLTQVYADYRNRVIQYLNSVMLEVFFQEIETHVGDVARECLSIYGKGLPNANHRIIAKLLALGNCRAVFTVNFDTLLEQACTEESGVKPTVAYRDADFVVTDPQPAIYKLHGCVTQLESIAFTIRSVGRGLSKAKSQVFSHYMQSYPTAFLGFSDNDYDITKCIVEAKPRALWLYHSDLSGPVTELLREIKGKSARWEREPILAYLQEQGHRLRHSARRESGTVTYLKARQGASYALRLRRSTGDFVAATSRKP